MKNHPANRKVDPGDIKAFLDMLAASPERIQAAIAGLDDIRLSARSDNRGWSAVGILAHLRSCADVWGDSIRAMLAQDDPCLPEIGPRDWIEQTDYCELEFRPSFQAFCEQRRALLELLAPLPLESWGRSADIGGRRHSVFSQVRRMAKHELEHIRQLDSIRLQFISNEEEIHE
jgi:hypothetical protein